jgi:M6 family metalloprotease-like protein
MALALLLISLLPFAQITRMQSPVRSGRPVAEFVTAADGSAPGVSASFEPPQGAGWPPLGPTTGTVKLAVIAAEFPDVPHNKTTDEIAQDYFGANNSLAAYYREVSYGQLSVTGDVFGWYMLPYGKAHYGRDCVGINDADCSGSDGSWQIAQDAVTASNNAINFEKYDYFTFVYSGNGQESSKVRDDVWSVTYVSGEDIQTTSRTIGAFSIVAEREAQGRVPLGVYCAEFGHLLGLPDMFNTATGRTEMGPWELEEVGTWNGQPSGSSPAEMSSWDRLKIGWLPQTDEEVLTQSTSAINSLNPLEDSAEGIRAAKITSTSSYYLLEVRRPIGFDRALPGFGVIAYEITNSDAVAPFQKVAGLTTAFDTGYLYMSNETEPNSPDVSFKVFDSFANGTYLIGFGPSSFMQGNVLTIQLEPAAANATVMVNGAAYSTDENGTLDVIDLDGTNSFNVTVPTTASLGAGSRVMFDQWSNGANSTTLNLPDENGTITAMYQIQYYVNVNTPHGTPLGAGWYDQGANATVILPETVNDTQPGTRYTFTRWQGSINGTSDPLTFNVAMPTNFTAIWRTQYYVDIDTGGHATALGAGWYDANSNAIYSLLPPNPANGCWYVFQGWSGDSTNSQLTGSINVTMPMKLTAEWTVLDWMTINFVDATGEPVTSTRALIGHLLAANGTVIPLDQNSASGLWLVNGTYVVLDVTTLGLNVSIQGQSFTAAPNGIAIIYLALYDITFNVHDVVTSLPISGAIVTVTMPDESTESNATRSDGTAVFQQLPMASYAYEVNGNWMLQSGGNTTITSDGSTKLDIRPIYIPSLIALVVAAFATAIVSLSLIKRRRQHNDDASLRHMQKKGARQMKMGQTRTDSERTLSARIENSTGISSKYYSANQSRKLSS